MSGFTRRIAVLTAALFNVGINALAGAGLLFGRTTGGVSDSISTGVTPAGWAFAIWTPIFVGVLVFAAWQLRDSEPPGRYASLALPFIVANLLNGIWQFAWLDRQFALSVLIIAGVLASLIVLYVRLDRIRLDGTERWTLGIPISLFLAWITVATTLNITVALAAAGWEGSPVWPPIVVALVALVGSLLLGRTGDLAFAGVLMWAFAAIYAANVESFGNPAVLTAVLTLGALAFLLAAASALRKGRSPLPVTT